MMHTVWQDRFGLLQNSTLTGFWHPPPQFFYKSLPFGLLLYLYWRLPPLFLPTPFHKKEIIESTSKITTNWFILVRTKSVDWQTAWLSSYACVGRPHKIVYSWGIYTSLRCKLKSIKYINWSSDLAIVDQWKLVRNNSDRCDHCYWSAKTQFQISLTCNEGALS